MSRHFCCCIPVRFAVFVLSFFSFLGAGISAAFGWFLVHLIVTDQLDKIQNDMNPQDREAFIAFMHKNQWGVIATSALFTIICLVSFFGFIGSIIRNRRMVKMYSFMTILNFIFGSLVTGFVLFIAWRSKPFCVTVRGNESCFTSNFTTSQKIGFTVGALIQWLIQLYIVVIIRRYVEQLEEEREYRHDFRLTPTAGGTYEAKEGLLTQRHYPYSDGAHAFGSNGRA